MGERHEIGAGLRQALEARGCALSAAEARALAVSLIDLIASGLLVASKDEAAVPSPRALGSARAVVGCDEPETAPAYNIGQSLYTQGGDRG